MAVRHRQLLASRSPSTPSDQREHWQRGREEYSRAQAIWLDLARKSPLTGAYAENPRRLQESIAACDEHGIAMIFTGVRHFRH